MMTNEAGYVGGSGRGGYVQGNGNGPARKPETELSSKVIQCERKRFTVMLSENHLGKLVRIREESAGGKRDQIVVPYESVAELVAAIQEVVGV